jgi:uncharacterized protein YabN with tetrapyrrole methylase and pyrophosphatase domain
MKPGRLVVVGTGVSVGHLTAEARGWISLADKVVYCVADAPTERLILKLNATAESLYPFYGEGKPRKQTYNEMIQRTLEYVRKGGIVCAAFYGHPGIFVYPAHQSIKIARQEGFPAIMLPAVSSIDCLFCDLGIDPSAGCQIFEATDLMVRQRSIDTGCHIVVLQVSALGDIAYSFAGFDSRNVRTLGQYLSRIYPGDFKVKSYCAAQYSVCEPDVRELTIGELASENVPGILTLYIPPLEAPPIHLAMLDEYKLESLLDGLTLKATGEGPEERTLGGAVDRRMA